MKNKIQVSLLLGGMSLLALVVCLCGIGLSLGMRKLSLVSFFSAIGLLLVLRLIGRFGNCKTGTKPES